MTRFTRDHVYEALLPILITLIVGFGALLYVDTASISRLQNLRHHETQTSRLDSAYISCLNSNNGNTLANIDILKVFAHPNSEKARQTLINDLRPLRTATQPAVPLPAAIPQSWDHRMQPLRRTADRNQNPAADRRANTNENRQLTMSRR